MTIDISTPRLTLDHDTNLWRLEAEVAGETVYFQSAHELEETSDAFLCAFFLLAAEQKKVLRPAGPVDLTLAENLPAVAKIAKSFWGFEGPLPQMQTVTNTARSGNTGMFFTCGVDSFYTLKANAADVRHLINVHGFDITLEDTDRYEKSLIGLQRTAKNLGLNLICVETNLRDHSLFKSLNWEITHGAALAAVGHTLTKHLSTIRIAGSDVLPPWGSHPDLDNRWSSDALTLINNELGLKRIDKVREIAHWTPAHPNLKVCWENRADTLNCGVCEKCVRTQTSLFAFDALDKYTSFPAGSLAPKISALWYVHSPLLLQWADLKAKIDDPKTRKSIRQLIFRSKIINALRTVAIKIGLRRLRQILRGR